MDSFLKDIRESGFLDDKLAVLAIPYNLINPKKQENEIVNINLPSNTNSSNEIEIHPNSNKNTEGRINPQLQDSQINCNSQVFDCNECCSGTKRDEKQINSQISCPQELNYLKDKAQSYCAQRIDSYCQTNDYPYDNHEMECLAIRTSPNPQKANCSKKVRASFLRQEIQDENTFSKKFHSIKKNLNEPPIEKVCLRKSQIINYHEETFIDDEHPQKTKLYKKYKLEHDTLVDNANPQPIGKSSSQKVFNCCQNKNLQFSKSHALTLRSPKEMRKIINREKSDDESDYSDDYENEQEQILNKNASSTNTLLAIDKLNDSNKQSESNGPINNVRRYVHSNIPKKPPFQTRFLKKPLKIKSCSLSHNNSPHKTYSGLKFSDDEDEDDENEVNISLVPKKKKESEDNCSKDIINTSICQKQDIQLMDSITNKSNEYQSARYISSDNDKYHKEDEIPKEIIDNEYDEYNDDDDEDILINSSQHKLETPKKESIKDRCKSEYYSSSDTEQQYIKKSAKAFYNQTDYKFHIYRKANVNETSESMIEKSADSQEDINNNDNDDDDDENNDSTKSYVDVRNDLCLFFLKSKTKNLDKLKKQVRSYCDQIESNDCYDIPDMLFQFCREKLSISSQDDLFSKYDHVEVFDQEFQRTTDTIKKEIENNKKYPDVNVVVDALFSALGVKSMHSYFDVPIEKTCSNDSLYSNYRLSWYINCDDVSMKNLADKLK